jgi:hypothetical protein
MTIRVSNRQRQRDLPSSRANTNFISHPLCILMVTYELDNFFRNIESSDNDTGLTLKDLLSKTKLTSGNGIPSEFCAICQDYTNDGVLRTINICEHTFHAICIDTWLVKNNYCPLCKVNLASSNL